jgi:hypothetical protein
MYTIQRNEGGMPVSLVGETPDERRAVATIEREVHRAEARGRVISRDTARLIASVIHDGPKSALGRFAASGRLDHVEAHLELFDLPTDDTPISWWRALDAFFAAEAIREEAA